MKKIFDEIVNWFQIILLVICFILWGMIINFFSDYWFLIPIPTAIVLLFLKYTSKDIYKSKKRMILFVVFFLLYSGSFIANPGIAILSFMGCLLLYDLVKKLITIIKGLRTPVISI